MEAFGPSGIRARTVDDDLELVLIPRTAHFQNDLPNEHVREAVLEDRSCRLVGGLQARSSRVADREANAPLAHRDVLLVGHRRTPWQRLIGILEFRCDLLQLSF
eukprot:scaffold93_cov233-Pinguiococcus_pyrenoidosus.AAC.5